MTQDYAAIAKMTKEEYLMLSQSEKYAVDTTLVELVVSEGFYEGKTFMGVELVYECSWKAISDSLHN